MECFIHLNLAIALEMYETNESSPLPFIFYFLWVIDVLFLSCKVSEIIKWDICRFRFFVQEKMAITQKLRQVIIVSSKTFFCFRPIVIEGLIRQKSICYQTNSQLHVMIV